MAILSVGIPDDSPENSARFIKAIFYEETKTLGLSVEEEPKVDGLFTGEKLIVTFDGNRVCLDMGCVHSRLLDLKFNGETIGRMYFYGHPNGRAVFNLHYLYPFTSFVWQVYAPGVDYLDESAPSEILSASLLRRLLREALHSEQAQ